MTDWTPTDEQAVLDLCRGWLSALPPNAFVPTTGVLVTSHDTLNLARAVYAAGRASAVLVDLAEVSTRARLTERGWYAPSEPLVAEGAVVDGVEVQNPPLIGDPDMPLHERHPVAPGLLAALRELGDPYGPMGVAVVAARLTHPQTLVRLLTGQRDHLNQPGCAPPADAVDRSTVDSPALREALRGVLNAHSAESESGTPDNVLAQYLTDCLAAYDRATNARQASYGRIPSAHEART